MRMLVLTLLPFKKVKLIFGHLVLCSIVSKAFDRSMNIPIVYMSLIDP